MSHRAGCFLSVRAPLASARAIVFVLPTAFLTLLPGSLSGQELRGRVFAESRIFPGDPAFTGQRHSTVSPSFGLEPELLWENGAGNLQITIEPFLRVDAHDGSRTHFDLRQANAVYFSDGWTMLAGFGKVFWGKTEANHLVDIINQTDGVEDIDTEDKLGQPMVNFTLERDWGAIDFFFLPYFRERSFAGSRGRLRGQLPVLDEAVYESDAGRWHPDFAVRWSYFAGEFDVGVSAFRGTSREPLLVPVTVGLSSTLQPRYDIIDQLSIDVQWTRGPTLWKLEAMTRGGHGDRFAAAVAGVEHTFFQVGGGTSDLGVLGEVMVDRRDENAPFSAFDHDLFFGVRWALNDTYDTSILGGPVIDYETGEMIALLEAERRIRNSWVAEFEARILLNTDASAPLSGLRRDDFLTLRLSRYF
ncbi:MAG: hypothetical protein ABFS14_12210 [Gemmatimonadota bacterium]